MSEQPKKLNLKSIILVTVVLPVIVIAISSVAIYFTASSAAEQKTFDISLLEKDPPVIGEAPRSESEAEKLIVNLFNEAVESGLLKFTGDTRVSFEEIKTENEAVGEILSFAASSMSDKCSELYEDTSIKYGEDASHILSLLPGSAPGDFTAEIKDGILNLTMTYTKSFNNMYFINADRTMVEMFRLSNEPVFSCVNKSPVLTSCEFTLKADCSDGELISYGMKRVYDYSTYITFVNSLAAMGTTRLQMNMVVSENYDFSYAGISIEQEQMSLTKNGYEALSVIPFVEEGLSEDEYSLEFISSDPSVATVDENGQVEAVKISDKPVEITVKLNYLGRDFSDTCTVYVVKAVEKIKISDSEITLKPGEEKTVSAEVSPDDATVKDVIYYSSDESVVTVSEDGKITAVGQGTAVVSAISRQSLISAECNVTVTG